MPRLLDPLHLHFVLGLIVSVSGRPDSQVWIVTEPRVILWTRLFSGLFSGLNSLVVTVQQELKKKVLRTW
jgi:hypothetical protein